MKIELAKDTEKYACLSVIGFRNLSFEYLFPFLSLGMIIPCLCRNGALNAEKTSRDGIGHAVISIPLSMNALFVNVQRVIAVFSIQSIHGIPYPLT